MKVKMIYTAATLTGKSLALIQITGELGLSDQYCHRLLKDQ